MNHSTKVQKFWSILSAISNFFRYLRVDKPFKISNQNVKKINFSIQASNISRPVLIIYIAQLNKFIILHRY